MLFATIALAVMTIACLSFAMTDGKRPKLKNTKWEHKTEMFVADAGTQTITMTFEFTTKKDVTQCTETATAPLTSFPPGNRLIRRKGHIR